MSIEMRVIQKLGYDKKAQAPILSCYDIQYRTDPDGPWTTVPVLITDDAEAYQRMKEGDDA